MDQTGTKNWHVLYTKPRHEKKVAERLTAAGYTVYCPLQKVVRTWSDRTKVVDEPLFKGYIFIQIEGHKRDEVFAYPGTVSYLFWLRRPATIQKWLCHYHHERLKVTDITHGTCVRITSGNFMNEEGVLIDTSNSKALVQLKELGIQLSLDLTQNDLEALQRPS